MTHPNTHFSFFDFLFVYLILAFKKKPLNKTQLYSLKHCWPPPRSRSYRLDWKNLLIATSVALSLPQVAPHTTPLDAGCIRQCRSRSLDQSWRVHLDKVHSLPSQVTQHTPSAVTPRQSYSVPQAWNNSRLLCLPVLMMHHTIQKFGLLHEQEQSTLVKQLQGCTVAAPNSLHFQTVPCCSKQATLQTRSGTFLHSFWL